MSKYPASNLRERVEHGAELLDEAVPGWTALVAPEAIEMNLMNRCVAGQVALAQGVGYGDFVSCTLYLDDRGTAEADAGFDLYFTEPSAAWDGLKALWTEAIERRRTGDFDPLEYPNLFPRGRCDGCGIGLLEDDDHDEESCVHDEALAAGRPLSDYGR